MKIWLLRIISCTQIAGSIIGIATLLKIVAQLFTSANLPITSLLLFILTACYFFSGVIGGIAILESRGTSRRLSIFFQAIQVPMLTTSLITYQMGVGIYWFLIFQPSIESQRSLSFLVSLGTDWRLSIFASHTAWAVGINIIALMFLISLILTPNVDID